MAYLDYPGLSYFKSLLDETYLRTSYTGDTTIAGDVTFTGDTVFSKDITGNVDGKAKKDWRGQQIDSTYIKSISTNDNVGQIVYTKGDDTSNYIMIDMMQGATASAAGKAGLVPAPTISERTKFLRGDGEWGVPTDIYVTQNLINTNDSFPILIGATAGATESQIGTAIAFGTKVSVNPNTHALIADHLILKHPTYRRDNAVTSKVMYTLNFADSNDGNGNNLSEIYGYIDKPSEGGEHELGFRLFGNPNVQGVEEIFTYLSVGLSKTNIPYGHAPETPVPTDHNEDTDIITRSYLGLNGSITGLVHIFMDETIDGYKTFLKTITIDSGNDNAKAGLDVQGDVNIDSGDNTKSSNLYVQGNNHIHGNEDIDGNLNVDGASTLHGDVHIYNNLDVDKNTNIDGNETIGGTLTITDKLTANGTAEIKGGSGNTPSLKVTGNETVTGDLSIGGNETVTGNISTTSGNISTTNGTVSGKTGSIGAGGLTVTGPSNLNGGASITGNETVSGTLTVGGKITGNSGAAISGGNGLQVTGNETVSGNLTVSGTTTTEDLTVTDDATIDDTLTVGGSLLKKIGNTTQEYVSYITNQQSTRETIINNMIKDRGGLAIDSNKEIYVKLKAGGGIDLNTDTGELFVNFDMSGADAAAQEAANAIKNQLLAALGLQIPLTKNMVLYVDPSNESSTDNWRNTSGVVDQSVGTRNKPFKTINTAVECATSGYALGKFNVTIYVMSYKEGISDIDTEAYSITSGNFVYKESVDCPTYNRTTGYIYLYPYSYKTVDSTLTYVTKDYAHRVTIDKGTSVSSTCIAFSGAYKVYCFNLINNINYDCAATYNSYPNIVNISKTGNVNFYGCRFESKFLYGSHTRYLGMRPINVTGVAYFQGGLGDYPNEFYFSKGAASALHVIYMWEDSLVDFPYTNNTGEGKYMIAEGDCSAFIYCSGATVRDTGGQDYAQSFKRWEGGNDSFRYDYDNTAEEGPALVNGQATYHLVTGEKYVVANGGHCSSVRGGFPGNANGRVSAETYSAYTGSSNSYNWNSSSPTGTISE